MALDTEDDILPTPTTETKDTSMVKKSEDLMPEHVQTLAKATENHCSASQQKQIEKPLCDYADIFSKDDNDVRTTDLVQHDIPIKPGARPVRQPPRRLGHEKEKEVEKQIEELLKCGIIEPAQSAWSSPVVLVKKKDGKWQFCVDYRQLNAVTEPDVFPLPRIDESLEALSGNKFFSTLDLLSGYWQVPLSPDAQEKSTFITRSGLWKWRVLPFGLISTPATFQRLMENVLCGLHWKTLLLYLG